MAFIGTPVITMLSDRACLITGVQLADANTTGTIGFAGSAADIALPAGFVASSYVFQGTTVTLDQSVQVNINPVSSLGLTNLQPSISYTGTLTGTNPSSFRINVTNTSASLTTQTLAILITNLGAGRVGQPARLAA